MSLDSSIILLDGPMGTELAARGVKTPPPEWSAAAIDGAPEIIAAIHRDYAEAGATVHTTATFRTREDSVGEDWLRLARRAVEIARAAVPSDHLIAGSVAPIEDCYRPDLVPPPERARREHAELCGVLADAGVDLILCETFTDVGEGLIAVECALKTGLPVWAAFSPGPDADLLTPAEVADACRRAVKMGVEAALVNCVSAELALPYVAELVGALEGSPARAGVYANAGPMDGGLGWGAGKEGAVAYGRLAREWALSGSRLIGGCCGTSPEHIGELHRFFAEESRRERGPSSRK